jgi:ribosomal protein L18E
MNTTSHKYCLDSNIYINAWNNHYAYDFCPQYWDTLKSLIENKVILLPKVIYKELLNKDDNLKKWIKQFDKIAVKENAKIIKCFNDLMQKDEMHKHLVDIKREKSEADPWLIAHALAIQGVVVSNEAPVAGKSQKKVKIPDVCNNMGIECINEFELVRRLNIHFSCTIKHI